VTPPQRLADTGEFGLLASILPTFPQGEAVLLGPGDDAAVLDLAGHVVVCTDVLVEGVHFRADWSTAHDVGRKAVAVNAADVAAMGACTVAVVVGLAAPADTPVAWLTELTAGLRAESATVGCSVVGGDTVAGPVVTVAVTAVGTLLGAPVTRAGARPGDVVAVCGRLGYAAAGLAVLRRGFRSPRALVDVHRCPLPPYADGPRAAAASATSMIDVSDGLLADLGHVAEASGVHITVDGGRLDVPEELRAMARGLGADPRSWVLAGGEDHALAATFPPGTPPPDGFVPIGEVGEGSGVSVSGWDDLDVATGYEHFSG